MTDLEEQLRRELKGIAERAKPDLIRPLSDPPRRRRSRAVRWLAPVTAAAAVAGLIAGLTVAGHTANHRLSSQAIPHGTPRYYVALSGVTRRQVTVITATVRTSATGARVASVQLPGYKTRGPTDYPVPPGAWITAAASDRLFVIGDLADIYVLRLAADGRHEGLSKLSVNIPGLADAPYGGALSPNGRLLALSTGPCWRIHGPTCPYAVVVFSLATGAITSWRTNEWFPVPLNWTDNGRKLFLRFGQTYRLLTVAGPGGSLRAHSVYVAAPVLDRGWSNGVMGNCPLRAGKQVALTICLSGDRAMLTPDGRSVIGGEYRQVRSRNGPPRFTAKILEFSARTGRLQRVLHVCGPGPTSMFFPGIESLAPSGLSALVYCVGTGFGRLEGSHFTLLPGLVSAW